MGLRTLPREDSNVSMAERMFGVPLNIPGSYLEVPEANNSFLEDAFDRLQSGLPVWPPVVPAPSMPVLPMSYTFLRTNGLKPSLSPLYMGPLEVIQQSWNTTVLQMGSRQEKVNISRLKPYTGAERPEPVLPPRRGRPPRAAQAGGAL